MSLVSQISTVVSAISAAIKSDRARISTLENGAEILGESTSTAKTSIAIGGQTTIVLTANGVPAGSALTLHPTGNIGAGMNISCYYVSAANQITIVLTNTGLVMSSIPAMTWRWAVIR